MPAENYSASIASSKTDIPIPKVGPPFLSGIITKWPHLHKKPLYAIMTNPLSKPINKGEEEGEGGGTFLVRYQKKKEKKLRNGESLLGNH